MIKKIITSMIMITALTVLSGCPGTTRFDTVAQKQEQPTANNVPTPNKVQTPEEVKSNTLQKSLEEAIKRINDAIAKGDLIAKLSAEKEALMINVHISESNAKQWEQNAKSYSSQFNEKNIELKNAKLDAWKEKLWWMAGICGFLSIVAGGIAWGWPLIRPLAVKASAIFGAVSVIMLIVAQTIGTIAWILGLVPYILGVGILIAIIFGILALRHWYKDHHGLEQTIEGIEPLKANIPGFSDHMVKFVDGSMVSHIKDIRNNIQVKNITKKAKEEAAKIKSIVK